MGSLKSSLSVKTCLSFPYYSTDHIIFIWLLGRIFPFINKPKNLDPSYRHQIFGCVEREKKYLSDIQIIDNECYDEDDENAKLMGLGVQYGSILG